MTVTAGQILTAETLPAYLKTNWEMLGLEAKLGTVDCLEGCSVDAIQGGNVNYAFCLCLGGEQRKVFVKQAPEFVAIFGPDGFPLTSERMQREMDVYSEYKAILGDDLSKTYLPEIYAFDKKSMVVVMEFFDGYELLDHVLVDEAGLKELDDAFVGSALGDFMGRVHAATHSSKLSKDRIEYLTNHFENREMRDVQLEFVFSKCYNEASPEQQEGLNLTEDFLKEVELLKNQYNATAGEDDSLVLTHGDLHPGSVMVKVQNEGGVKVIDPEFTVYGPAGLDVGSLLSGYCLAAIHQEYSKNPEAIDSIVDGAKSLWHSYTKALKEGGLTEDQIKAIEIQTVGFTVAEVCRTALEFAGGRKWLQFEDPATKKQANKAALGLVDKCMIRRHDEGISILFTEMQRKHIE